MKLSSPRSDQRLFLLALLALAFSTLACLRSADPGDPTWMVPGQDSSDSASQPLLAGADVTRTPFMPPTRLPGAPILTPTPDEAHSLPTPRSEPNRYEVQPNDTLGTIAQRYGITLDELITTNRLKNPNLLEVGQVLTVPVAIPQGMGPDFKVIPDSELVYGPASIGFNTEAFIKSKGGYLAHYSEEIDGKTFSGAQVVERVAQDYSVNPRLLLAVLQYQSQWLTRSDQSQGKIDYPVGIRQEYRKGLYHQLAWAANNLNRGYYVWKVGGSASWLLADGSLISIAPTINPGTAGVQAMFAALYGRQDWEAAITEKGLFATYNALFGYPFDLAIEPLVPAGVRQPPMQLPFEPGQDWAFTGGPHGGWDSGSAWAALDFAPPIDALGCVQSDIWVVAVADGMILRADHGAVIQDLDGDGYEQTGWVVLYMHIETRDRVRPGTFLKAGQRIGHPSCEGGEATGTHLHLARRYNGEWISADQTLPFVLDGWVSRGLGQEYDGYLEKKGQKIEAWVGLSQDNVLHR